jgi:serine/threonine protein kinase
LIGKTLSHFEITAKLGEGGMGEVYRATDTKLGRDVAIKILPAAMALDPELLERFRREARALAALDHPNIVTVYSVEESDGVNFLAMGLVDGKTLDQQIPPSGLAPEAFFDLAIPLADALAAAHQKGVTHRDLKPANVMVTRDGRVMVLDFGLAKLAQPDLAPELTQMPTEAMTQAGTLLGTVPYMSPEQIEGKPADSRSGDDSHSSRPASGPRRSASSRPGTTRGDPRALSREGPAGAIHPGARAAGCVGCPEEGPGFRSQ